MMIETQYQDLNGSVCPLCGGLPHVKGRERLQEYQLARDNGSDVEITFYHNICENGHYFNVISSFDVDNDDGINHLIRCFVDSDDWDDHNGVTTFIGPQQVPHLLTEDVIWQQHLLKLKAGQKQKRLVAKQQLRKLKSSAPKRKSRT